jgi:hypothetical protein
MKRWLAALGLLAVVATAPARAASPEVTGEVTSLGGGTFVAVDGTTVTIIVRIDLCCFDEVATTLVAHIMNEVKAAENMWNEALAKLPAHGCFDMKVVFDVRLLMRDDRRDPGYHQVQMDPDRPCTSNPEPDPEYSQRSWAAGDPNDPNPPQQKDCQPACLINGEPPDFDAPYRRSLKGWFCASAMNTTTYAHEIGHFMGLRDDYSDVPLLSSVCFAGRGGTLMCGGRKIDQALADRLFNIVNFAHLPQCWKGTLKIASNFMPNKAERAWSDTWKTDLKVFIDAKGKASGSGVNRRASPVRGHPYGGTPVQEIAIAVSGDADHVRLRLQFLGRPCVTGPAVGATGGAARGVTGACGYSPAGSADFSRVQMVLRGAEKFTDPPRTYVFPVTAPGVAKGQFDIIIHGATGSDNTGTIDGQLECTTCKQVTQRPDYDRH